MQKYKLNSFLKVININHKSFLIPTIVTVEVILTY
jgi:hypothetical protein